MNNSNYKNAFLHGNELYHQLIDGGTQDAYTFTVQLMMYLGFKSKLVGTQFLLNAILFVYSKGATEHVSYTNEVYPAVAKEMNSTVGRVERAIRNSIINCNDNGNLVAFYDLIHCQLTDPNYPPSNSELISSIVTFLHLEEHKGHIA